MTPADDRVLQLLQKWQKSLDLHAGYADLPEDQYWLVQPWPQHQRPTPWIVDLASQRLMDLQRIVQTRIAAGDPSLSEALELMSFLANLVGSQHVQRYIPMAEPEQQRPIESLLSQGDEPGQAAPATERSGGDPDRPTAPKVVAAKDDEAGEAAEPHVDEADADVVRDAIRLLGWGRAWHELPNAIARMSGRPNATQVRQILKAHRKDIEGKAAGRTKRA